MPRYFFHTQAASHVTDAEGIELPNLVAAQHEAVRASGEMLRDGAERFWGSRPWSVTVVDDAGLVLLQIEMRGHAGPANAN